MHYCTEGTILFQQNITLLKLKRSKFSLHMFWKSNTKDYCHKRLKIFFQFTCFLPVTVNSTYHHLRKFSNGFTVKPYKTETRKLCIWLVTKFEIQLFWLSYAVGNYSTAWFLRKRLVYMMTHFCFSKNNFLKSTGSWGLN